MVSLSNHGLRQRPPLAHHRGIADTTSVGGQRAEQRGPAVYTVGPPTVIHHRNLLA